MVNKMILVVDDEETIRDILREALEHEGYHVRVAANGKDALQLITDYRFDLVVADIVMPEMNGLEMILKLQSEHLDLKVIAMSAGGLIKPMEPTLYLRTAKAFGAIQTMAKPFDIDDFLECVRAHLD